MKRNFFLPKINLRLNVAANAVGRAWQIVLSLAVVPLYIKILGIESYGLIGFYAGLQGIIVLLDFGLGGTLNRELARNSAANGDLGAAKDTVRTFELVYWGIGTAVGLIVALSSSLISRHWLTAEHLSQESLEHAVAYMGIALILQWPFSLYNGGLMGLQRQVLSNLLSICALTIRMGGAVLLLLLVSSTIEAYFLWQIFASALQTGLAAFFLWRSLPDVKAAIRPKFRFGILTAVWRYGASLSLTSIFTIMLSQTDKIVLSAILPLATFGYYVLANTIAMALGLISTPVTDALFPRIVQLVHDKNIEETKRLFHKSCQLIAGIVFPIAAVLVFYSEEILILWTHDARTAHATYAMARILIVGVALNTVMGMLDFLQTVNGWLKPGLFARLIALLFLGPVMWIMALEYGGVGAALVWLLVYSGYVLITPKFVFAKLLDGEMRNWYARSWGGAFAVSFAVAALFRWVLPTPETKLCMLGLVFMVWAATFFSAASVLTQYRMLFRELGGKLKFRSL